MQNVALETGLLNSPATVVNNTADDVENALALAVRVGQEIARKALWAELIQFTTFDTVATTQGYALASDFDRFVSDSLWNQSSSRKLSLVTQRTWNFLENGIVAQAGIHQQWIQQAQNILINPVPTLAETIEYEYITDEWVQNAAGSSFSTTFAADTDTTRFPEYLLELGLKVKIRKRYGDAYQDDLDEFNTSLDMAIARTGGNTTLRPHIRRRFPVTNIQDGNFPS